jgi:hypothetical protein
MSILIQDLGVGMTNARVLLGDDDDDNDHDDDDDDND